MELVSASKMRKSVGLVLQSRTYAQVSWQAVTNIVRRVSSSRHVLLQTVSGSNSKACIILMSSNRGLCGGFNAQIITSALKFCEEIKKQDPQLEEAWIVYGRKGGEALARMKKNIIADYPKSDVILGMEEILPMAKMVMQDFVEGKYRSVFLAYTDFQSALRQKPKIKILLPFSPQADLDLGSVMLQGRNNKEIHPEPLYNEEYEFEPSPEAVLDVFLQKLVEVQIYQAALESSASEHAARMLAMRQATDAAADMIFDLTLAYNQVRQTSITREIAEISSGKAALE